LEAYPRVRHVLCTDVDRDGLMQGPNLELYRAAQERFGHIAWQASGGVSSVSDLHALAALNVSAAISGKALLDGTLALEEIGSF
jgi:phosphoribosylformimino-5-aminoimidazole carboxamide ribotide isomerase